MIPEEFSGMRYLDKLYSAPQARFFRTGPTYLPALSTVAICRLVESNPGLKSYPYSGIQGCDLTYYETQGGSVCSRCPELGADVQTLAPLLCFFAALFVCGKLVYHVASSQWRPSNKPGAECVVHSGRLASAKPAAELWKEAVRTHLDLSAIEVELDHSAADALEVGDEVMIMQEPEPVGQDRRCWLAFFVLKCFVVLITVAAVLVGSGENTAAVAFVPIMLVYGLGRIFVKKCCSGNGADYFNSAKGLGTVLSISKERVRREKGMKYKVICSH